MKKSLLSMALLSVLIITIVPIYAQEEKVNEFYGLDNLMDDPNSIIKLYNSGGFSLKNYDFGIAIFAHPITNTELFKFTVIENGKVSRFVAGMESPPTNNVIVEDIVETMVEPTVAPKTIYPKSSVGADITKYDIPIITRDDVKKSMLLTLKTNPITSFIHGDRYDMNGKIYDARTAKILEGAEITVQISRDGYVIRELDDVSNKAGIVRLQFDDMSYPEFWPSFCYQVKAELKYGNVTSTWKEDFNISNIRAGTLDFSWLDQTQWNYLPNSFREIPPQTLTEDKKCNGV